MPTLDERDKGHATRALLEVSLTYGTADMERIQHLLAGIAEMPEGIAASEVASIVVPMRGSLYHRRTATDGDEKLSSHFLS